METFYVYKLSTNNIPFYIGKGKKNETYNRIEYHLKYWEHNNNKKLKNKINKLKGIFDIEILFESKNEQECLDLEIQLIKEIGRENLCNLTDGGEGVSGFNHSEEAKQKISVWRKGKPLSKKTCCNISENKTGNNYKLKNIPEGKIEELYETKSIQEIANILNFSFATIKKYLTKKNMYVPSKNRPPRSEISKNLMSNLMKNKGNTPVYQFDLNGILLNEFKSLTEACLYVNKPNRQGDITACCRGKQKTAFGYIWKYKEN